MLMFRTLSPHGGDGMWISRVASWAVTCHASKDGWDEHVRWWPVSRTRRRVPDLNATADRTFAPKGARAGAAALRDGPTRPASPSTHEADGRPYVHPLLPTPEGRAARPGPGPHTFPAGPHAAASYAARSRTPPPVRGRGARSANTARRSTR